MRAAFYIAFVVAGSSFILACSKPEKHHPPKLPEAPATAQAIDPKPVPSEPVRAAPKADSPPAPIGTAAIQTPPPPPAAEKKPAEACAFEEPQFFGSLPAKWEGGCEDGKAHGRGVLRSFNGKKVAATFFGSMDHGNPKLGVVEDRDGLIVGRFAPGGKPIESDAFKDRLDAVNEAVAAANQIKEFYERAGNTASAAFYAKKAKMLDKQIE
jgi:hypothetical protein